MSDVRNTQQFSDVVKSLPTAVTPREIHDSYEHLEQRPSDYTLGRFYSRLRSEKRRKDPGEYRSIERGVREPVDLSIDQSGEKYLFHGNHRVAIRYSSAPDEPIPVTWGKYGYWPEEHPSSSQDDYFKSRVSEYLRRGTSEQA